jgi:D-xylulose reductase
VRKIIGIDNSPFRVEFAKKYISPLTGKPIFDAVYLNTDLPTESLKHPPKENTNVGTDGEVGDATAENDDHETVGDIKWEHAKLRVQGWVKELGLEEEEGVDRVVEASGAEDCMLLGVAFGKQGGTCTSSPSFTGEELISSPTGWAEPCPDFGIPKYRRDKQGTRCQR